MFGRILTSTAWGYAADHFGRRPVLMMGCFCVAATAIAFGFTFSYPWAIACRFLSGMLNATNGTGKTVVSEVASQKHSARGTALHSVVLCCVASR